MAERGLTQAPSTQQATGADAQVKPARTASLAWALIEGSVDREDYVDFLHYFSDARECCEAEDRI